MKLLHPRPARLLCATCTLAALSVPALLPAQPAADAANKVVYLDAFTVHSDNDVGYQASQSISGSRFVTDVASMPFSMQILNQQLLEDTDAQTLSDAFQYVTGAVAAATFYSPDTSIQQRGFPTLLHLRDGIRKPGGFDAIGAERIEVISGPSSVLFGITNPGGTVNYVSKQPVEKPLAKVTYSFGSWAYSRTTGDFGGPLGSSGNVSYRLPVAYETNRGYFRYNSSSEIYASPSVAFHLGASTKVLLSLEAQKHNWIPLSGVLDMLTAPNPGYVTFLPNDFNGNTGAMFIHDSTAMPTLTVTHWFGGTWELRNVASFYHDIYQAYYENRGATFLPALLYPRQAREDTVDSKYFQDNLDLVGKFDLGDTKLTAVMGAEWQDNFTNYQAIGGLGVGGSAPPAWQLLDPSTWNYTEDARSGMTPIANNTTDQQTFALSGLVQWSAFNDRLIVAGGLRHDKVNSTFNDYQAHVLGQQFDDAKTSAQVGVMYRITPQLGVYANYSSSFQPLSQPLMDINRVSFSPKPIEGKGTEAGIKLSSFGDRLTQSLAVYQIDQENLVETLLGTSSIYGAYSYNVQGGLQRSQGVEYSFNGALTKSWFFLGGVSYDDARVVTDDSVPSTAGQRLIGAFRYKGDIFTKYVFQTGFLRNVFVTAGYVRVGDSPAAFGRLNTVTFPHYGVVNASVGYSWKMYGEDWAFVVNAKNLNNQRFINFSSNFNPPRSLDATLRVSF